MSRARIQSQSFSTILKISLIYGLALALSSCSKKQPEPEPVPAPAPAPAPAPVPPPVVPVYTVEGFWKLYEVTKVNLQSEPVVLKADAQGIIQDDEDGVSISSVLKFTGADFEWQSTTRSETDPFIGTFVTEVVPAKNDRPESKVLRIKSPTANLDWPIAFVSENQITLSGSTYVRIEADTYQKSLSDIGTLKAAPIKKGPFKVTMKTSQKQASTIGDTAASCVDVENGYLRIRLGKNSHTSKVGFVQIFVPTWQNIFSSIDANHTVDIELETSSVMPNKQSHLTIKTQTGISLLDYSGGCVLNPYHRGANLTGSLSCDYGLTFNFTCRYSGN